jgi:hypothetical protein
MQSGSALFKLFDSARVRSTTNEACDGTGEERLRDVLVPFVCDIEVTGKRTGPAGCVPWTLDFSIAARHDSSQVLGRLWGYDTAAFSCVYGVLRSTVCCVW